jgi:hypothetical protein
MIKHKITIRRFVNTTHGFTGRPRGQILIQTKLTSIKRKCREYFFFVKALILKKSCLKKCPRPSYVTVLIKYKIPLPSPLIVFQFKICDSPSFDETIHVNFPRLGIEPGTFIFPISSAEPKQLLIRHDKF